AEASSPNTPPEANSESREIQNLCELTRSSQMNTAEASSPNTPPEANSECREMPEFMYFLTIEVKRQNDAPSRMVTSRVQRRYQEKNGVFWNLRFLADVAKMVAKISSPGLAAANHPILTPVKLSSQP
ncbi:hypothetical protein AVEN_212784-1, partial [Araneus ventricosus]